MEILAVALTNLAISPQKVNMSESVQKQTIEQSPFSVHKDPHLESYVFVCSTFNSEINIRLNNISYQTIFVNSGSQTNMPLCKQTRPF